MKSRAVQPLLAALALLIAACATPVPPTPEAPIPPQAPAESRPWLQGWTIIPPTEHSAIGCLLSAEEGMIGSGILIAPRVVLTAGHCVDGKSRPHYFSTGGGCYPIHKIVEHPLYKVNEQIVVDAALVFLSATCPETPVALHHANEDVSRYDLLTVVGYGGGIKKISNPGVFWCYGVLADEPFSLRFLTINGTAWFGDSGGAILNSKGELVAVTSAILSDRGRIFENIGVRIQMIRVWIHHTLNQQDPALLLLP